MGETVTTWSATIGIPPRPWGNRGKPAISHQAPGPCPACGYGRCVVLFAVIRKD